MNTGKELEELIEGADSRDITAKVNGRKPLVVMYPTLMSDGKVYQAIIRNKDSRLLGWLGEPQEPSPELIKWLDGVK